MQIYLEGNELNFKTTVANKLAKALGYTVVKGSSFEIATGTNEDMFCHSVDVLRQDNIVVDRFIYSNYVYARLYPKYTRLNTAQYQALDYILHRGDKKRLIVYLHADVATLAERMRLRGDEHIKEERLGSINSMYEQAWAYSIFEPVRINTNNYTSDEIVDTLMEIIRYLAES